MKHILLLLLFFVAANLPAQRDESQMEAWEIEARRKYNEEYKGYVSMYHLYPYNKTPDRRLLQYDSATYFAAFGHQYGQVLIGTSFTDYRHFNRFIDTKLGIRHGYGKYIKSDDECIVSEMEISSTLEYILPILTYWSIVPPEKLDVPPGVIARRIVLTDCVEFIKTGGTYLQKREEDRDYPYYIRITGVKKDKKKKSKQQ
jgi:hypothetical protein